MVAGRAPEPEPHFALLQVTLDPTLQHPRRRAEVDSTVLYIVSEKRDFGVRGVRANAVQGASDDTIVFVLVLVILQL